jgi:hypothetical protein
MKMAVNVVMTSFSVLAKMLPEVSMPCSDGAMIKSIDLSSRGSKVN